MTQAKWISGEVLALAVNDAVKALSRGARAVLLSHPDALRVALAVVAETIEVKIDLDGVAAKLIKAPGVTIPNREFHAGF